MCYSSSDHFFIDLDIQTPLLVCCNGQCFCEEPYTYVICSVYFEKRDCICSFAKIIALHKSYTNLCSHQQHMKVKLSIFLCLRAICVSFEVFAHLHFSFMCNYF